MPSPAERSRTKATSSSGADDVVLPFRTESSGTQGRIVHLGAAADAILAAHDYPEPVNVALGEALALTALLGSLLHANGRLILQTKTDGPLRRIVASFTSPGDMRALATFDADKLAALSQDHRLGQGHLLGSGHLAMTIDPGGSAPRTQGIVALSNHSLAQAAYTYFRQSEQIPTFVRLAVARQQVRGNGAGSQWRWRAGGLIIQQLPRDVRANEAAQDEPAPRTAVTTTEDDLVRAAYEENWNRARMLASTVEDHELLDPTLPPETLLYRLFAEEGVSVLPGIPVRAHCGCSRARVEMLLKSFGAAELTDMREPDGGVTVTCEYCTTRHWFSADEVSRL